jgi:hypothetical protein
VVVLGVWFANIFVFVLLGVVVGARARALAAPDDARALAAVKADVEALCAEFPLYPTGLHLATGAAPR